MFVPYGDDVQRTRVPIVVIAIILLNVIVAAFEVRVIQDSETDPHYASDIFMTYSLVPADIQSQKYVGLFTHMFMHAGFMHIFGNMLILWAFGPSLEELLGRVRFAAMYFLTGILAALTHVAMNWGSSVPSLGASGAIAGIIGAYGLALGPDSYIRAVMMLGFIWRRVRIPMAFYALFWLFTQWVGVLDEDSDKGGVAYACHVGGFFGGMLVCPFLLSKSRKLVDCGFGVKQIENTERPDPIAESDAYHGNAMDAVAVFAGYRKANPAPVTRKYRES